MNILGTRLSEFLRWPFSLLPCCLEDIRGLLRLESATGGSSRVRTELKCDSCVTVLRGAK